MIFLNRNFHGGFFIFHQNFHPRPTCTAIIGFPIVIALIPGNARCCLEQSDWQKIRREKLIIFFEIFKNVFIVSEMMLLGQESKYNGKVCSPESKHLQKA